MNQQVFDHLPVRCVEIAKHQTQTASEAVDHKGREQDVLAASRQIKRDLNLDAAMSGHGGARFDKHPASADIDGET